MCVDKARPQSRKCKVDIDAAHATLAEVAGPVDRARAGSLSAERTGAGTIRHPRNILAQTELDTPFELIACRGRPERLGALHRQYSEDVLGPYEKIYAPPHTRDPCVQASSDQSRVEGL